MSPGSRAGFRCRACPRRRARPRRWSKAQKRQHLEIKRQHFFAEGERLFVAGQSNQARAAYGEAMTLFKQVYDVLGEANVLVGLGDLESVLGRYDQARAAYGEAIALYNQVDDRLGQANVLSGLGKLDSRKNPNQAAIYFAQSAQLYEMIGMKDEHDAQLRG